MIIRPRLLISAIALLLVCTTLPADDQNSLMAKISRGPFPQWVKQREIDYNAEIPQEKIYDGMWWLHTEIQLHFIKSARFARYAKKIVSSNGVTRNGKIVITFDPHCQTLCLNRLQIRRGDKVIDRTQTQEVHFFGKRDSRELKLYDNRIQATMILDDLRVGDIIEYAYTITGNNPILNGMYTKRFYANSNKFVRRSYLRVLWPKGKRFFAKNYGKIKAPVQSTVDGMIDIEWAEEDLDRPPQDDGVPGSCIKYRFIDVTECDSWATVARWAAKLFTIEKELPVPLAKLVEEIRKAPTPEDQALKALRYVQMEIRYLYMGLGAHMVKPYPLETIWGRRFGDCKDKTKLLCAILRKLRIDAVPVFVNTQRKQATANFLPSTRAFNHVVTRITIGGQVYWVDPTRTHQGGTLATNYFPPYGWGLVLDEKTTQLTPIPGQALELTATDVVENYQIPKTGTTQFDVTWSYHGRDADYMRKIVAGRGLEDVQRRYASGFMGRHVDARVQGKMTYNDDPQANEIKVSLAFETDEMWKGDDRSRRLYPISLGRTLHQPKMAVRTLPYRIRYPNVYTYTINVKLPQPSAQYPAAGRVIHPAFEYTYKHEMIDKLTMRLHHSYKARSEVVQIADMDDFRKKMDNVIDGLCYDLYEPDDEALGEKNPPKPPPTIKPVTVVQDRAEDNPHTFGLAMIGAALLGAGLLIGFKLGRRSSQSSRRALPYATDEAGHSLSAGSMNPLPSDPSPTEKTD